MSHLAPPSARNNQLERGRRQWKLVDGHVRVDISGQLDYGVAEQYDQSSLASAGGRAVRKGSQGRGEKGGEVGLERLFPGYVNWHIVFLAARINDGVLGMWRLSW